MNRTRLDHRLARLHVPFVVPAVPPIPPQPGEGPLHHPTLRQLHESHAPRRTLHHLALVAGLGPHHPAIQGVVPALLIGPDLLQPPAMLRRQTTHPRPRPPPTPPPRP